MPRTYIKSRKVYSNSRKVAAARGAVARAARVLRSRNVRLRRRNTRTAGFLGIETKFLDTSKQIALVSDAGCASGECDPTTVLCLNAVAQGDGESQRDGKNYVIKGLYINGYVSAVAQANQTQGDDNTLNMIAVVLDTQTNAAQLNSEDVFSLQAATATFCPLAFRNLQYSKRFKVLWMKRFALDNPNLTYDGTNIEQAGTKPYYFTVNLPNLNIRVETKGTSANVTDIIDNSLHIIGFTSSTNMVPTLYYQSRVRFVG